MNQAGIDKLKAHTDHLVNSYLGLIRKYAFVDPMVFDQEVTEKYGKASKALGFETIRLTIYYSCIQDVANVCSDKDDRSPSVINIIEKIKRKDPRDFLRKEHTTWSIPITNDVSEPVKKALIKSEDQKMQKRGEKFDETYARLLEKWDALKDDSSVKAFKAVRDQITAHFELRLVDGEYEYMDIKELGLRWDDLKRVIEELEEVIMDLNLLVSVHPETLSC